ncbi:MAG: hypothetical protein ABI871_03540 [Chthoniobacterales bacterium]
MRRIIIGLLALAGYVGVTSAARANLELEFNYALHPDTPQRSYNAALNHFDHFTRETFFNPFDRVNGALSGTVVIGDFKIVFIPDSSATITWNFTGADDFFLGVYVAGTNRGNLYENIVEMEGEDFRGTATVHAPRSFNGEPADISHIDFFNGRAQAAPDSGGTLLLLGGALGGLRLVRRVFVA